MGPYGRHTGKRTVAELDLFYHCISLQRRAFLSPSGGSLSVLTTVSVTAAVYFYLLPAAGFSHAIKRIYSWQTSSPALPAKRAAAFLSSSFSVPTISCRSCIWLFLPCVILRFFPFFCELLLESCLFQQQALFCRDLLCLTYLLFTALLCLCLYRPYHHFSDRAYPVLHRYLSDLNFGYFLCLEALILFRTNIFAARLLCAVLFYSAISICFTPRKFRETSAEGCSQADSRDGIRRFCG